MSATTLRIDSRLVHGQIVESWLPALKANAIVVIDEKTASSQLARAAMRLALPPEVTLTVLGLEEAQLDTLESDQRVLVLVASIETAVRLVDRLQLAAKDFVVNVGVVHHTPDRRQITPGIHLSEDEIDLLCGLSSRGFTVEVRGLPNQPALAVEDARTRFLRHTEGRSRD